MVNPADQQTGAPGSGGRRSRASTSQYGFAALGLDLVDQRVEDSVLGLLAAVEVELRESIDSADPLVVEAARHLVDAGGKRFRPLLVALGAQFGDPTAPLVVPAAVVMELTHLATLYHDDVMDEAARAAGRAQRQRPLEQLDRHPGRRLPLRPRGRPRRAIWAPKRSGCRRAPSRGWCTARSPRPSARAPGRTRSRTTCAVIADKTGSLIATSARFGGMFGGATRRADRRRWRRTARRIGVAFQLSDDLLDIASESTESGKTPGTDLREGVPTLPVLYALAVDDDRRRRGAAARDPRRRSGHRRRPARRGARSAARVAGA